METQLKIANNGHSVYCKNDNIDDTLVFIKDDRLLPCPFCGEVPLIIIIDDEGNIKRDWDDETVLEYEEDPWSGLYYQIYHPIYQQKN